MNLDTQELLRRYKIDVEYINLEDTFDLENVFYKRQELIKRFNTLTLKELSEFLKLEKEITKHIPEIKKRYSFFYEKVIEPATKELQGKIEYFREILFSAIN